MKKSEYFNIILDAVCEECEINRASVIKGTRIQPIVDARVLAIQAMRRVGMTNKDIALCVHRERTGDKDAILDAAELDSKARGIQKSFVSYTERCSESHGQVFIGHAIVVMWFIHRVYGVPFYGKPPRRVPEKIRKMISELTEN